MSNSWFQFKQFLINHQNSSMPVGTDAVLLGSWVKIENPNNILEIGCGSGVISLMLAQRSEAQITAIDIHKESCLQAFENKEKSHWSDRINIENISLQDFSQKNLKFDLIVSNPPYFSNSLKADSIERNLARHNDNLSLKDLIFFSEKLLSENGRIALVLPIETEQSILNEIKNANLFLTRKCHVSDNPNKNAKRILLEIGKKITDLNSEQLFIRDLSKEFSEEYKILTKEFYLNF